MKKIIIILSILFIVVLVSLISISKGETYIKNQSWKFTKGFHVGDLITFRSEHIKLKSKLIYKEKKIIAEIFFCTNNTLIIKNLENGEKGYYTRKKIGPPTSFSD